MVRLYGQTQADAHGQGTWLGRRGAPGAAATDGPRDAACRWPRGRRSRSASWAAGGATARARPGSAPRARAARSWVTRATSSRSGPRRSAGSGGADRRRGGPVPSEVAPRPAAAGRRCAGPGWPGPAGQRGALAEELDLDAVADDVAVAEQADDVVGLERPQHLAAPAVGPRGTMFMPSGRRKSTNHSNSSGGSTRLDHDGDRHARHLGEPEAGPLPAAEVGQGEDRPGPAGRRRSSMCSKPSKRQPGVELGRGRCPGGGTTRPSSGRRCRRWRRRRGAGRRPSKSGPWTRRRLPLDRACALLGAGTRPPRRARRLGRVRSANGPGHGRGSTAAAAW